MMVTNGLPKNIGPGMLNSEIQTVAQQCAKIAQEVIDQENYHCIPNLELEDQILEKILETYGIPMVNS